MPNVLLLLGRGKRRGRWARVPTGRQPFHAEAGRPAQAGHARSALPRSSPLPTVPPVHVPVSFMCPTLAEIRAGEPVLRGPGWQPLADLQTRERWPHAAHGFLSAVQLPLGKAG